MAEVALVLATRKLVDFLAGELGDYVTEKLDDMNKVQDDAQWLKVELGHMLSFLKEAERTQDHRERITELISNFQEIADQMVEVLEEFNDKMGVAIVGGAKKNSFLESVRFYACACKEGSYGTNTFDIAEEIGSIRARVEDIKRIRETYAIPNINLAQGESSESVVKRYRRTISSADAGQLFVGFEDVKRKLLDELLKEEPLRCVVSIHGMGGLGKTTLARNLYNSTELTQCFSSDRAWVCVSEEYNIQELLRTVIQSFSKDVSNEKINNMNEAELERHLRDKLKGRPYLIVVDDLWKREAWESLKRALPDDGKGSRVIVTTRNKDIATGIDDRVYAHRLRQLDAAESWNLFMKKVSPGQAVWCRSLAMKALGEEMVAKCGGLPLAIVVLGGLLARKRNLEDWQKLKGNIWKDLAKETVDITHLLSLSYNDLSHELQQCFLYVGSYPEDSQINAEELKYLWMGERFIIPGPGDDDEEMEEVAQSYLDELIDRNLIQGTDMFWDKVVTCRVHDLIRDLAVKKALDKHLFDIYHPRSHSSLVPRHRHIVHTHTERYLSLPVSNKRLRSPLLLNLEGRRLEISSLSFGKYQHLCVLKLVNVGLLTVLPDAIGNLGQLKVFVVLGSMVRFLPPSIGRLNCLEILEVENSEFPALHLPLETSNLTSLRQLITYVDGDADIGALSNLRVLKSIQYAHWTGITHDNLVNLQELVIEFFYWENGKPYTLEPISKLNRLHTLVLCCSNRAFHLPPLSFLSSCGSLRKLWLEGPMGVLPPAEEWPESITMLRLSKTRGDPILAVSKLPNLRRLDLHRFKVPDGTMFLSSECFPELEILSISKPYNMTGFLLEEGALPKIKQVYTFRVPQDLERQITEKLTPAAAHTRMEYYSTRNVGDFRRRRWM